MDSTAAPHDSDHPTRGRRVADPDREWAVALLQRAFGEERLDRLEFEQRLERALAATHLGDLQAATAGLLPRAPATAPPRPSSAPGRGVVPAPFEPTTEERLWAALAQGSTWVPVLVVPAVVMGTVGNRSAYVRHHAAGALNLQLTLLVVTICTFGLGAVLYGVAWIAATVTALVALTGNLLRYPYVLRAFGRGGPYGT